MIKSNYMKKIIDYLFIFSKLTTSLIMLLIIIIFSYLLYSSYKNIDNASIDLDSRLILLSNSITNNNEAIKALSEKVQINNENLSNTKTSLDGLPTLMQVKNYENQITNLKKTIEQIKLNTKNMILESKKKSSFVTSNQFKNEDEKKINSYLNLIKIKFKNGDSYNEEMLILEKIIPNNKKVFFEKLILLNLKQFYGLHHLADEFNKSINIYTNEKFLEENQNSVVNFLLKFVTIRPSNLSKYQDEELNILMRAKNFMVEEKILDSLNQILLIEGAENFFSDWIVQTNLYLDFMRTIEKVT